jgi:hypothetical protein
VEERATAASYSDIGTCQHQRDVAGSFRMARPSVGVERRHRLRGYDARLRQRSAMTPDARTAGIPVANLTYG